MGSKGTREPARTACRTIPELRSPSTASDTEAVLAVHNWASTTVIHAANTRADINKSWTWSGARMLQGFRNRSASVLCGGSAWFLAATYRGLGYPAYAVNFGKTPVFTHVVTVVKVGPKWLVMDPTYGTYLTRRNGQPAGLRESLRWLSRSRGATEVVAKPPRQNTRAWRRVALQDAQEYLRFWKARYSPSPVTCISEGDGYVLCSTGIRAFNKSVSKRLVRKVMAEADLHRYRRSVYSLMLEPLAVSAPGTSVAYSASNTAVEGRIFATLEAGGSR